VNSNAYNSIPASRPTHRRHSRNARTAYRGRPYPNQGWWTRFFRSRRRCAASFRALRRGPPCVYSGNRGITENCRPGRAGGQQPSPCFAILRHWRLRPPRHARTTSPLASPMQHPGEPVPVGCATWPMKASTGGFAFSWMIPGQLIRAGYTPRCSKCLSADRLVSGSANVDQCRPICRQCRGFCRPHPARWFGLTRSGDPSALHDRPSEEF